jgi:hypothetical protein
MMPIAKRATMMQNQTAPPVKLWCWLCRHSAILASDGCTLDEVM